MSTGEFRNSQDKGRVDPVALGKFAGNIVNGLPEYPTHDDIACAQEMARMGLLHAMTDFDETAVPDEIDWDALGAWQDD